MGKVAWVVGIVLVIVVIFGIWNFFNQEGIKSVSEDYRTYSRILNEDSVAVSALKADEPSPGSGGYTSWATQYTFKLEQYQQHVNAYLTFLAENEEKLKAANYPTVEKQMELTNLLVSIQSGLDRVNSNLK